MGYRILVAMETKKKKKKEKKIKKTDFDLSQEGG